MTIQYFITGLLAASILTSLSTEAIKKLLSEQNKPYKSNLLAGITSFIISFGICCGYVVYFSVSINSSMIFTGISFMFLTWLCAMLGYDKVMQALEQLKK